MMRLFLQLALVVLACTAQGRSKIVQSLDMRIPVAPAPVAVAGQRVLAYELHLTNLRPVDVTLTRVEVRDAARKIRLAEYSEADLSARLGRPGFRTPPEDKRVIGGGLRAVLYVWLALDGEREVPARLEHVIETDAVTQTIEVEVRRETSLVLDAPLPGGPWVALHDPSMMGGHRTAIYTVNGRARIPARFAIDFMRLDHDGSTARGDATRVANWHGFGADVLAVADGVVTEAHDDIAGAETIAASQGAVPLETASGNYVILNLGAGRHAVYEHLQHGSIRVKAGDRVKRRQPIARLGNTGSSSSGPHLHFHVSDANATLEAEGLPYVFRAFEVIGAYDTIKAATSGVPWKGAAPAVAGKRTMELPPAQGVVVFTDR